MFKFKVRIAALVAAASIVLPLLSSCENRMSGIFPDPPEPDIPPSPIIEYAKVNLDTLIPLNGSLPWGNEVPEDPLGNDYTNVKNYAVLHAYYHTHSTSYSAEYNLDFGYSSLSFDISAFMDISESGSSFVQVYVDDVLRYTSPYITQKSDIISTGEIDISNGEYMKIVAHVGGHGCMMMTNAVLVADPEFRSQLDRESISLSKLEPFNGSLPWNSEYPSDRFENNYTNVKNYAVLHAYYHTNSISYSAEYNVNKEYSNISFDIAPCGDFGEGGKTVIEVYADDELVYTSPEINQKTEKFNTGKIDIGGADYIKIKASVGGYSCTIISDVLLKKAK